MPAPSENPPPEDARSKPAGAIDDAATGLPWLRTWRAVYLFVLGSFVVWVLLLTVLTRMFS